MPKSSAGRFLGSSVGSFIACCLSLASTHAPTHAAAAPDKPPRPPQPAQPGRSPHQTPVVIPGYGTVAWAADLEAPPTIIFTRSGVSATWTQSGAGPRATRTTFTVASADGQSFSPPIKFDQRLQLRYAPFDPLAETPEVAPILASSPDSAVHIVQFTGAIVPGMLLDLADAGAVPQAYLPSFAYITTIPPNRLDAVRALPCVRAIVPYHPAYRLDEAVRARVGDGRKNSAPADAPSLYNIQTLVPGPSLKNEVIAAVTAAGGVVDQVTVAGSLVRALLTPEQVVQVAQSDAVLFIDDAGPPEGDMDIVRQHVGADYIFETLGFSGEGVRGMVVDDSFRPTHAAFQTTPPILLTPTTGDNNHGTSCFGIMFGNGAVFSAGRGLMPNAEQGYFADYDFMADRVQLAITACDEGHRCVVQSNSWGHPWTYSYTTDSYEADLAAYSSGMLIVQSQSNSGGQWSRPEAWAKNIVSVGGIVHRDNLDPNDDCYCGLASVGPAADGRVKPDLALYNDRIGATAGWSDFSYNTNFSGTSASTPGVAGCAGLIYQMWHEGVFPGFGGASDVYASRPATSTVRALLVSTAYRYEPGGDITRFRQGWGIPRIDELYRARNNMLIVDQSVPLQAGQRVNYPVAVAAGTPQLAITMAYRDPPGTTSSLVHRVNDLTLSALSPSGVRYWGNAGLLNANVSSPDGEPDNRNVIENVFLVNPEPGMWNVTVHAAEINQDSRPESAAVDADFSLVIKNVVNHLCSVDWNHDLVINSTDVSDFINDWFTDQAQATDRTDVDRNGVVNSTDVSIFINKYLGDVAAGCE